MKTFSNILHLSVLLLALPVRCAWGVEVPTGAPERVGILGDPARLFIEGVQTFTEDDIRRALQSDLDYLVAAHPEASLSECLAAVEKRIRAGYHDCGFPDVAVQARFDLPAGRIVVKVTEGPRFRCGALQVTGLKSIPVADFIRRFAEKLARHQTSPPPIRGSGRRERPQASPPTAWQTTPLPRATRSPRWAASRQNSKWRSNPNPRAPTPHWS